MAKIDYATVGLKESLVLKSLPDEFLGQKIDIIFGLNYGDEVMQGQSRNADACLMAKVGQLHA